MKKGLIILLIFITSGCFGQAIKRSGVYQWLDSTFFTGNAVGIGTTIPTHLLEVQGTFFANLGTQMNIFMIDSNPFNTPSRGGPYYDPLIFLGQRINDSVYLGVVVDSLPGGGGANGYGDVDLVGYGNENGNMKYHVGFKYHAINIEAMDSETSRLRVYFSSSGLEFITNNNATNYTMSPLPGGLYSTLSMTSASTAAYTYPVLHGATGSEPVSPYLGQLYFDTTLTKEKFWNGSAWALIASTP